LKNVFFKLNKNSWVDFSSTMSSLTCSNYSDKAIVVRGSDMNSYEEELQKLGGKYNAMLKGGGGWIFSKQKESKVRAFISEMSQGDSSDPVGSSGPTSSVGPSSRDLLEQIKARYASVNHAERLRFLIEVTTLLAKEVEVVKARLGEKTRLLKPKPKVEAVVEDASEDEEPLPRKRLL
jgi:hypothetical protein